MFEVLLTNGIIMEHCLNKQLYSLPSTLFSSKPFKDATIFLKQWNCKQPIIW